LVKTGQSDGDHDRYLHLQGHPRTFSGNGGDNNYDPRRQELNGIGRDVTGGCRPEGENRFGQTEAVKSDTQGPAQKEGNADGPPEFKTQAPGYQIIFAADANPHIGGNG